MTCAPENLKIYLAQTSVQQKFAVKNLYFILTV